MPNKPKQLFTYAIAVFESLWPKLTDSMGDERPKLVGDGTAASIYKHSSGQNEFSGYFKLIPLNLMQVEVSSSVKGHQFSLLLDSSLLYVEADPKSLSPKLAEYLMTHALPESTANSDLLVGIMEGFSRDAYSSMESLDSTKYILPGSVFSQLVSELDTCTIFMVNDLGSFVEDELIRLNGGSFSRINELDISESGRSLLDMGILPTQGLIDTTLVTDSILAFRSFLSNKNLYLTSGLAGGVTYRLYSPSKEGGLATEMKRFQELELKAITTYLSEVSEGDEISREERAESTFGQEVGPLIASTYLPQLRRKKSGVASGLSEEVKSYYSTNPARFLVPWSVFKTATIQLENSLGGEGVVGLDDIAYSVAIDLIASSLVPAEYTQSGTQSHYADSLGSIKNFIDEKYGLEGSEQVSVSKYLVGVQTFAGFINKTLQEVNRDLSSLERYSPDAIVHSDLTEAFTDVLEAQKLLGDLNTPASAHTPGLVLKGHITGIETTSSVSEKAYTKAITVKGEGLELPLKRHSIFFDNINRGKELFINFMRMGLTQSSPIDAAVMVMETFAPDFVKIREANTEEVADQNDYMKNSAVFRSGAGTIVDHGTVIYPSAHSLPEDALLATPIHYVHLGYLKAIKDIFDEVALNEYIKSQIPKPLEQTNIYNVLSGILGPSSAYTWYVDEFGFIKVRYENAAAVSPSLTALSPMISDDNILSLTTSSSEESVYTLVEVVPHALSMASPSEGKIPGIFGRATPPTVEDYYALYDIKEFDLEDEGEKERLSYILQQALAAFDEATVEAFRMYTEQVPQRKAEKRPTTSFNDVSYEKVKEVLTVQPSTPIVVPTEEPKVAEASVLDWGVYKTRDPAYLEPQLKRMWEVARVAYMRLYPGAREPYITEVYRSSEYQDLLYEMGNSRARGGESKHNYIPSRAFDIAFRSTPEEPDNWEPPSLFYAFSQVMKEMGAEWSGDWNVPGFVDLTHFEIPPHLIKSSAAVEEKMTKTVIPVEAVPEPEVLFDPPEVQQLYQETTSPVQTSLFQAIHTNNFGAFSARTVNDVLIYDLNHSYFNDFYVINDAGEKTISLYDYVGTAVEQTVHSLGYDDIKGFTFKGQRDFIRLLATLSTLGANPENISDLLNGSDNHSEMIKFILKGARIRVNPKKLDRFPTSALILNESKSRALPYKDLQLQDTSPGSISADLFRYGVRIYRLDDYFMSTLQFTNFRAEGIRRLHEEPIREASVQIVGNPIYKVGNTVLVSSREVEERKSNYIHKGTLETLRDLGDDNDKLIFKVEDGIEEGVDYSADGAGGAIFGEQHNPLYVTPEVSKEGIRKHFEDAYTLILDTSVPHESPVPISAYVPLYGVYGSMEEPILSYLRALVKVTVSYDEDSLHAAQEQLQDSLLNIVFDKYGSDYTVGNINYVLNLLAPQNYHAYQYYIEQVSNKWQYGGTYRTSLTLNYGLPAALCNVPTDPDNPTKFHTLGYLLNRSPYMTYDDLGRPSELIKTSHPMFTFTLRQQAEEWHFYKNSERYKVALTLDSIRKKILHPMVYGGIIDG